MAALRVSPILARIMTVTAATAIVLSSCDSPPTAPLVKGSFTLETVGGQPGPAWDFSGTHCTSGRIRYAMITFGRDDHSVVLQYACHPEGVPEVQHGTYETRGDSIVGGIGRGEWFDNDATPVRGLLSGDRKTLKMVFPELGVPNSVEFVFSFCESCLASR